MFKRSIIALCCILALAGCTPPKQPKTLPPQTVSQAAPSPSPPSDPAPSAKAKDDTVVMVDAGAEPEKTPTLVEASRAERERRERVGKPAVVITNKNLPQYAKGQLTTAEVQVAAAPPASPFQPGGHDEAYWRSKAKEIRQRWRDAADDAVERQADADRLRIRFYSEDDPYVRDTRIKPEWDRALDKLDADARQIKAAQAELDAFLDEGDRAGALPGWLREGQELEPEPEKPKPAPNQPSEPKVLDESKPPPPPQR